MKAGKKGSIVKDYIPSVGRYVNSVQNVLTPTPRFNMNTEKTGGKTLKMQHFATAEHVRFHNMPDGFSPSATRWKHSDGEVLWDHGNQQFRGKSGAWMEYRNNGWHPCDRPELENMWILLKSGEGK